MGGPLADDEFNVILGALDMTSKTAASNMTPLDKVRCGGSIGGRFGSIQQVRSRTRRQRRPQATWPWLLGTRSTRSAAPADYAAPPGVHALDRRPARQGDAAGGGAAARGASRRLIYVCYGLWRLKQAPLFAAWRPSQLHRSAHPPTPHTHFPAPTCLQRILESGHPPFARGRSAPHPLQLLTLPQPLAPTIYQRILESGHSRVPVYEGGDRSKILGLIITKELLQYVGLIAGPQVRGTAWSAVPRYPPYP